MKSSSFCCRSLPTARQELMRNRRGFQLSSWSPGSHGLCFVLAFSRPASFITAGLANLWWLQVQQYMQRQQPVQTVSPTANYPQQLCFSDLTLTQIILMSYDLQGEYHCNCLSIWEQEGTQNFLCILVFVSFKMPMFVCIFNVNSCTSCKWT